MTPELHVLIVAKAPVVGLAKTRLAAELGDRGAARVAAAALLDTLAAAESVTAPDRRLLSLVGDLGEGERSDEIRCRLDGWHVITQAGETFADRLAHAHREAARLWGAAALVVQVGMDTPQLSGDDLDVLGDAAVAGGRTGCALGPAVDGGWWGLATVQSGYAEALSGVPMSRPDTGDLTAAALRERGAQVTMVHSLRDVDTLDDAVAVADAFPALGFSQVFTEAWRSADDDKVAVG